MFRLNRKTNQILILPTVPIEYPPTLVLWPTAVCTPSTPFCLLPGALRVHRFADEDDVIKHGLREELRRFSTDFRAVDIRRSTQRLEIVLIMK
jgi:hypothetical protein